MRSTPPSGLAALADGFTDPRYGELLFRYRARNWPDSLDAAECGRWDQYRQARLGGGDGLSEYDFTSYYAAIAKLRAENPPGPKQAWLDALDAWGHDIQRSLA